MFHHHHWFLFNQTLTQIHINYQPQLGKQTLWLPHTQLCSTKVVYVEFQTHTNISVTSYLQTSTRSSTKSNSPTMTVEYDSSCISTLESSKTRSKTYPLSYTSVYSSITLYTSVTTIRITLVNFAFKTKNAIFEISNNNSSKAESEQRNKFKKSKDWKNEKSIYLSTSALGIHTSSDFQTLSGETFVSVLKRLVIMTVIIF